MSDLISIILAFAIPVLFYLLLCIIALRPL